MKTILSILSISILTSCFTQQPKEIYTSSSFSILNTVIFPQCEPGVKILDNQKDLDALQYKIPKSYPRSGPLFKINFEEHNVAIICKNNIYSYSIDSIITYKKENILFINPIPNFYRTEEIKENLILLQIPKAITTLKLN